MPSYSASFSAVRALGAELGLLETYATTAFTRPRQSEDPDHQAAVPGAQCRARSGVASRVLRLHRHTKRMAQCSCYWKYRARYSGTRPL